MASYTEHLNLLKKNPATDGADTFNIETMLNENWNKIDEAVAKKAELGADGKIPAEQLPEMNYDTAGSAAAVQKNLDTHTGNKSNPHGVTAAQVGARADTWVPSWSEVSGKPGTFPPSGHNHDAANINSGTLPVARGGTGVPTLAQLAQSLFPTSIGSLPDTSYNFAITGPQWNGNGYMSFQALMSQITANGGCRIASGSYVGVSTAEDSSSGPAKVFYLPFVAKALIIVTRSASDRSSDINSGPKLWIAISGATYVAPTYSSGNQKGCAEFVWSGTTVTVSGYDTKYPNWNGSTYDWFALG